MTEAKQFFDYLTRIFTSDKVRVSRYIDIDRNEIVKEAFEQMSGLGMSIATKNFNKGMQQGMQQEQNKAFMLMEKLFKDGRIEDAKRAAIDPVYQKQMMKEYAL